MVDQNRRAIQRVAAAAVLRSSPKLASLSPVRRAALQEEIELGLIQEGPQYGGSALRRNAVLEPQPTDPDRGLNRGVWLKGNQAAVSGIRKGGTHALIAHSPSFVKQAGVGVMGGGVGSTAGASVERLAPEVYSPLFTMANLNLPRDRITVNAWCFLPGTMVWMADGTRKPIEEIRIGDMVLSGEGVPRRVTTLFRRPVDEEIVGIRVKGSQETVWCTKNHSFMAVKADEVRCHDKTAYVKCKPDGQGCFCSRCGRQDDPYEFHKVEAGHLEPRDALYMPVPKLEPVSDDPLLGNPDALELLGYYAAEGSVSRNTVVFSLGAHEEKLAERIAELSGRLFADSKIHVRPDRSELYVNCTDANLAKFVLQHCGEGSLTKRLSYELMSAEPAVLLRFLVAWLDGDGSQEKDNSGIFCGNTSSEFLAWQMRMLCLRLGLVAHVFRDHSQKTMVSPSNGKTYEVHPRYHVKIRGKSASKLAECFASDFYRFADIRRSHERDGCCFLHKGKAIQWLNTTNKRHYAGFVHNIEIETDHSYNVGYGLHVGNCRNYFDLHPLVRNAVTLHATYPISKLNIKCADKNVERFFEDMIEEMDLLGALGDLSLEYWKLGEAFPYAELDENTLKWKRIVVQNPDYIHVKKMVVASEPVISLRPDEVLRRLVMSNAPADVQLRKQIPQHIIYHVRRGENIPLDNFNVSHLKMLSSPYDVRGTSVIVSAFKDLMLYDKIREAKFAQADDLVNPITLVKVGGTGEGEFHPDAEQLEAWRQVIEEAQYDKNFKIITHAGVAIERAGSSGAVLDIAADIELIIKNIMHGLMVPQAVIDTESAVYASASIGLEVLRQRYFNFRNMLAKWLVNKIFAPISDLQGFYRAEGGYKKLIVPEVEWNHMNLYDLQDYISNLASLVTAKQVSLQTLYRSLGLNYEEERTKMRQEARNDAIRQREEQALASMSLLELRALDPEREIMEPTQAAPPAGGMPTGAPGAPGAPGAEMGGMPPMGGGAPGGGGGLPGGLPELAPPPGEAMGGPGGAGAPAPGGLTPPLGPGGPGAPPGGPG